MNSASNMSGARLWAAYLGEMRFEFIKSLRTPAFAVPTLFFPIMFYVLFGIFLGSMRGNSAMSQYTFATYGVFGAMGPGLFGFGVSLAIEREQGLLTLKQALPQPPGAYLLARAAMAMLFVAIISLLLTLMAVFVGARATDLLAGHAACSRSTCSARCRSAPSACASARWSPGQASPAIVNLIFLPMAFLSGLWLPLQFMPKFLTDIAPVWPAYHLAQMALDTVGAPSSGHHRGPRRGARRRHAGVLPARDAAHARQRLPVVRRTAEAHAGDRRRRLRRRDRLVARRACSVASRQDGAMPPLQRTQPPLPPARPPPEAAARRGRSAGGRDRRLRQRLRGRRPTASAGSLPATTCAAATRRAAQRLVDGGAGGSKGALEVTGAIGRRHPVSIRRHDVLSGGPAHEGPHGLLRARRR